MIVIKGLRLESTVVTRSM